ncbi:hypothetical protein RYX36_034466 [Vicia faba]
MEKTRFIIESSDAKSMGQSTGLTLTQLLPTIVKSAQPLARVPISKFHVAAVGVGISGGIFIGVNVEFPDLPFHHTIHVEQFLLTNLSQNKETHLQYLAVLAFERYNIENDVAETIKKEFNKRRQFFFYWVFRGYLI